MRVVPRRGPYSSRTRLVANRLVGGSWELDLHRLSINRVREDQLSFVQARQMVLHILRHEAVNGIAQLSTVAAANHLCRTIARHLPMYLAHELRSGHEDDTQRPSAGGYVEHVVEDRGVTLSASGGRVLVQLIDEDKRLLGKL